MFFKGSRYEKVPEATHALPDGRVVRYKRVRVIPPTEAATFHRVAEGERLDLVAHLHYRDPERFWRIADANEALRPDDVLVPGRLLRIPPPEG